MFDSFDEINQTWPGVVVDINDPLKLSRIKVNIPRFFGTLEVEDIPWASPSYNTDGKVFNIVDLGKVVHILFPNGDIYHPVWTHAEHSNINLQKKLLSLTEDAYQQFQAISFDAKLQIYADAVDEGFVLDYVKSKIQIMPDGNIIINLRDNASTLNLGSKNASQSVLLGNRFIEWMDEFMKNLVGNYGGPYLGNLMAPIVPNPAMLQICNKYFAIRSLPDYHFLSDRVKVVDNDSVIPNTRKFDEVPESDEYLYNDVENTTQHVEIYKPTSNNTSTGSSATVNAPTLETSPQEYTEKLNFIETYQPKDDNNNIQVYPASNI